MAKSIEDIEKDVDEIKKEISRLEFMRDTIRYERALLEINHQKLLLATMWNLGQRYFGPPSFHLW